ncbi:gliding-motility protein MglA [candidate division WOR-3 bacterium]|jgi:signal recognition particle receptor subunit beta|nr:gliding-motility protein MglA [candidate division WOR-3 bacterium]
MALINYASREINAKIVYYGPGLGGKTTNIKYIYTKLNPSIKGKLISLATELDRTLFFDFLPVDLGTIRGFKTRFHLYTVPGQVFYNASRKLILRGVDGIIFVADSQIERFDENIGSLDNMMDNLKTYDLFLEKIPFVIQYNKRDLPNITSVDELQKIMNSQNTHPYFEAVATQGIGVFETLKEVCKHVLKILA